MPECGSGNDYNGNLPLRISAIFVIFVGSFLGAWFPIYAGRHRGTHVPAWAFFAAKYFGSGVILATAFIHLLAPANEALSDECLEGPITEYPWAEGISMMVITVMFFVELMTMRFAKFGHDHGHDAEPKGKPEPEDADSHSLRPVKALRQSLRFSLTPNIEGAGPVCGGPHVPGDNHLSHSWGHVDRQSYVSSRVDRHSGKYDPDSYAAQMTALAILEFGVVFHSVLIGLTLAVAGDEFKILYAVLTFHQTFEGLALGTRLAEVEWPVHRRWLPYVLGSVYALATPGAIAIGLGIRKHLHPGSSSSLIASGVLDSISSGILIYTGLIELMAHEFMFSEYMQQASIQQVLSAFGTMCMGAALMALLGRWA
ncbi:ZIP zinc/iron transport family [Piedraia hortae CBS 480.64]|uniref:ZIP zinc/iron transport family n=1 Tax=Piedraia hortae CBS 480.64 TaxID=1314780 RepID=A0A6A7C6Y7_9PEZI|nr:ZIP zinc/iron transport family [Piedraia hortae CBS 480.64]